MLTASPHRRGEDGVAILMSIALLVLAAFVIVGIFVASRASNDLSRERLDSSAGTQLARDASAALGAAYSAMESGEFDGFAPAESVYRGHATRVGGFHVRNGGLPAPARAAQLHQVDPRVPASSQFAVAQPLGDARFGWWQVYSVKLPDWGVTPGGRVVTYIRTWTSAGRDGAVSLPSMYRVDFRPRYFADYQMLFDGPTIVGSGAVIEGPVHTNGQESSFMDQYRPQVAAGQMLTFEAGSSCRSTARISLAAGNAVGVAGCTSLARRTTERYNLLRARDAAAGLRRACARPSPSIDLLCLDTTADVNVRLAGSRVMVSGGRTLDARVSGNRPGDNQGAVLVASGRVNVVGSLAGDRARALVVTAAQPGSSTYGTGGAPSAWIQSGGNVGAPDRRPTSTFGLVAEGDVVFDETRACGLSFRGAILAMSGLPRANPTWTQYAAVTGSQPCGIPLLVQGSISSHYPPLLWEELNQAGYRNRTYRWLPALYDNPPPMYPTAGDWEAVSLEPANLDCFRGRDLDATREGCA